MFHPILWIQRFLANEHKRQKKVAFQRGIWVGALGMLLLWKLLSFVRCAICKKKNQNG